MKTKIKFIALLIIMSQQFTIKAQISVDYMGFPNSEVIDSLENPEVIYTPKDLIIPIVERVFKSPTTVPAGMTFDGEYLWIGGYYERKLFKVSTIDGSVLQTIPITINKVYGLSYNNNQISVLDNDAKKILTYSTITSLCVDTVLLSNNIVYPTGLFELDNKFIFNDTKGPQPSAIGDSTYFLNKSSNSLKGSASFGTFSSGITHDGQYLWINDNPTQSASKIDIINWQVIETIQVPGGPYPNGIAWDGFNLWVVNNASDSIYMLGKGTATGINNISNNTATFNVFPNPLINGQSLNVAISSLSVDKEILIVVVNVTGEEMFSKVYVSDLQGEVLEAIDLEGRLSAGTYFIIASSDSKVYNKKIIIK